MFYFQVSTNQSSLLESHQRGTYCSLCTAILRQTRKWMHAHNTSCRDDTTACRLVLAHEMNRKLGTIHNALVVDICAKRVRLRWDAALSTNVPTQHGNSSILSLPTMSKDIHRALVDDTSISTHGIDPTPFLECGCEGGGLGIIVRDVTLAVKEVFAVVLCWRSNVEVGYVPA